MDLDLSSLDYTPNDNVDIDIPRIGFCEQVGSVFGIKSKERKRQEAINALELLINKLESLVRKYEFDMKATKARMSVFHKTKDKTRAFKSFKIYKQLKSKIDKTTSNIDNEKTKLSLLNEMADVETMVKTMNIVNKSMVNLGIQKQITRVDRTMDSIAENTAAFNELGNVLATPTSENTIDDAALLKEFNEMFGEEEEEEEEVQVEIPIRKKRFSIQTPINQREAIPLEN